MKILLSAYSCQPNIGSEGGIGWNWALEISKRGHEVYVITRENNRKNIEKYNEQNCCAENIRFVYFDLSKTWLKYKHTIGIYAYYQMWQKGIVKVAQELDEQVNFDVVHHLTFGVFRQNTYLYKLNKPLYLGPLGGGEKMPGFLLRSLPFHTIAFEYMRLFSNRISLLNPALIKSFDKAESIFFKTKESLESIPQQYRSKSAITNDIGSFNDSSNSTIKKHNQRNFTVLYVGRLVHWKGPHLAILAFKELYRTNPDARLYLIGSGSFKNELLKMVADNNLQKGVQIFDELPQQEVFAYFKKASVFLFPTLHDSSGTVIYEALSFSLPVVTLNLNGPGFIMGNDYDSMVKVEKKDTQKKVITKLSDKLMRLYTEPNYYHSLSKASLTKAQQLTWTNIVDSVYKKIENKHSMPQPKQLINHYKTTNLELG